MEIKLLMKSIRIPWSTLESRSSILLTPMKLWMEEDKLSVSSASAVVLVLLDEVVATNTTNKVSITTASFDDVWGFILLRPVLSSKISDEIVG